MVDQGYGEAWVTYVVMVWCQDHWQGLGLGLGFGKL